MKKKPLFSILLARWAYRYWYRRGCYVVEADAFNGAMIELKAMERFCDRSGFLRDGRYPGGRHAERKLRGSLRKMVDFAKGAMLDETRAEGRGVI